VLAVVFRETPMYRGAAATAQVRHDGLERSAELHVEDGVQHGVDGRVGVAEPEQERVQPAR